MSYLGIFYEGLYCYLAIKMFGDYHLSNDAHKVLVFALIDALILMVAGFLFALLNTYKDEDFFKIREEHKNGIDLGRRKKDNDPLNMKIRRDNRVANVPMNSRDKLIDINDSLSSV